MVQCPNDSMTQFYEWELHVKDRAEAGLARDLNPARVSQDDFLHERQADAVPILLGRVKGDEHFFDIGGVDATASVAEGKAQGSCALVDFARDVHLDRLARFETIAQKVEKRLPQKALVALHRQGL